MVHPSPRLSAPAEVRRTLVWPVLSIKAEYRYSDFGAADYQLLPTPLVSDSTITSHSITAGVNFHF
jgi:outer membrane immunogenic protein